MNDETMERSLDEGRQTPPEESVADWPEEVPGWPDEVEPLSTGGTYYVSPTGKLSGDGSRDNPFPTVDAALLRVGGGNTIVLRPGFYAGNIIVRKAYAGTAAAPTVIKSEVKWKAFIFGSPV